MCDRRKGGDELEAETMYGCIEAGGTKMVCAVLTEDGRVLERISIPTRGPVETMEEVTAWFADKGCKAFGVAAFGPVDLNPQSETYGHILETTKTAWRYYDLLKPLRSFGVPIGIDTDVNGACLGEATYGAAQGLADVLYLTVGTGIGAGILVGGKPVHGMQHPEAGHVSIVRRWGDTVKSICPFHENCVEGLCSGPALNARYGVPATELYDREDVWELEADYLAQALVQYIFTVSPQRIVLGGGVMHQEKLFPLIREKVMEKLGGYLQTPELKDMQNYIVPSALWDNQGVLGCLVLAKQAMGRL